MDSRISAKGPLSLGGPPYEPRPVHSLSKSALVKLHPTLNSHALSLYIGFPALLLAHSHSSFRNPPTFPLLHRAFTNSTGGSGTSPFSSASCGDSYFNIASWPVPPHHWALRDQGSVIYLPWGVYSPNEAFRWCLINICWINEWNSWIWLRRKETLVA